MSRKKRSDVNYMEFRGGYVFVRRTELDAMIEGYKKRELRRNELRVYAATCEQKGLHRMSRVDVAQTLNCKSNMDGIRRLSGGIIERAQAKVRATLESAQQEDSEWRIAVSRRMLKHAASGGSTSNEIIVMLYYCMRRMRQQGRCDRLHENERYARFTYRELETVSGIPRANICRAVAKLRAKGFLNTAWVKKQNENRFGLLFVDGTLVSLTCPQQGTNRSKQPTSAPHETTTTLRRIDNAPRYESTTLINDNPKTSNQRDMDGVFARRAIAKARRQTEFERIRQRAEQMRAELVEQAA